MCRKLAVDGTNIRLFDFSNGTISVIPVFLDRTARVAAEVLASEPGKDCLGFRYLNRSSLEMRRSKSARRLAGKMKLSERRVIEAGYRETGAPSSLTVYDRPGVEYRRGNLTKSTRKAISSPKIDDVEEAARVGKDEEAE